MIVSALNCLSRFCCTCEADGARVRELMRVSAWLGLRSRMSVWVIAVFGIAMTAVAGTAAAQTPRLDVFDENVMEGNAITFKVLLSTESSQPVTVQYATASGADRQWEAVNAQSGSDFTAASGTLTFAPGETRKSVRVSTTEDSIYEWDERFEMRLSSPTNARLGDARATGRIDNDDAPPTVSVSDGSAAEGSNVEFKVSLSGPSERNVYVTFKPEVGPTDTATLLDDFDGQEWKLGIACTVSPCSATVRVVTTDDDIDENDETFTVRLSNPRNARLGDATAMGTIVDDDDGTPPPPGELPTVGFLVDSNVVEGGLMRFWVKLSKRSDRKVSVQYKTSSGTAQSGTDFKPASGLLVFSPGDTLEEVYVETTRDRFGKVDEGNETFTLTLSSPIRATLGDSTATGTITEADTDVDGSPYVAVAASTNAVEGKPVTFTVRLSAPSKKQATVQYETGERKCLIVNGEARGCGAAKGGIDYVETSGTLTFAPQETEKTVSVPTIDDAEHEGKEYLNLKLSNPTNAAIRTLRSGKDPEFVDAGILDNDDPPPAPVVSFASQASSVQEDAGTHNVAVNLSPAPTSDIDLGYSAGGTATHGEDYGLYGKISVPSGATTASIPLDIVDDNVEDDGETIVLTLLAGTGYTVGTNHTHTLTIRNHEAAVPTVSIARKAGTASSVTEGASASFTVTATPAPAASLDVTLTVGQSGDFAAVGEIGSKTVTVPASGSMTLDVTTVDDATDEPDGSVSVTVEPGSGYAVAASPEDTASIAVADDDAACVPADVRSDVEGYVGETHYGTAHVARWQKALDAFDGKAGGMTGTEARTMEITFSANRWTPVAAAIECLEGATPADPEITVAGGAGVTEGGYAVFTVSANPVPAAALTVKLTVADDGASDFLAQDKEGTQTVVISAGQSSGALTLTTQNDSMDEPDGSVTATLRTGSGYTVSDTNGSASVTVSDDDEPVVSIAGGASVTEGGDAVFTLTASPVPAANLTVTVAVADDGTSDFLASGDEGTQTVVIAAGQSSRTLTLTTQNDSTDEADGSVTATVRTGTGYTVSDTDGSASVAVSDNDDPQDADGAGDGTQGHEAAVANGLVTVDVPASWAGRGRPQVSGGAHHLAGWSGLGFDFRGLGSPPGTLTVSWSSRPAGDVKLPLEWQPVAGADWQWSDGGPVGKFEVAIVDPAPKQPAPVPELSLAAGPAVDEGIAAGFTITANPAPQSDITIAYTVAQGGDVLDAPGAGSRTVTLAAGKTSAALVVATVDDAADEPDGSVSVTLDAGSGYTVAAGKASATVAVSDDDDGLLAATPVVSIAGGNGVTEGGTARFTLTASPAPQGSITVDVDVADSGDFASSGQAGARQVTIDASGTAILNVDTAGDARDEPDGSVTATVQAGTGYTVSDTNGSASIAVSDDDPPLVPVVSLNAGAAVDEGGDAGFTITADVAPQADLTINLTVSQSGAYLGAPGAGSRTVTLYAGSKSVGLVLPTEDDALDEADGSVSVRLGAGTGYTVAAGQASATVTVRDDDEPEISITAGNDVTEGASASFTVTANPAPAAPLDVTVTVSQSGDFAEAGEIGSRTVTVPTSGSVTEAVATVDDGKDEPNGSITAMLGVGAGYTVAAPPKDAASVEVADNDAAATGPTFSVGDETAKENVGLMFFTVRLSSALDWPVSVRLRTRESSPVSAESRRDYWPMDRRLYFNSGQTEARTWVYVVNDNHDEDPETFELVLSDPQDPLGGAAIGDGVAVGTITNDDPMPAAWLARFGRTAAEQALDGIAGRMAAPRTPGMQGAIAGQALNFDPDKSPGSLSGAGGNDGDGSDGPGGAATGIGVLGNSSGSLSAAQSDVARAFGAGNGGFGHDSFGFNTDSSGPQSYSMTAREALLGSSFTATGETDSTGGSLALWGRAAQSHFDGREGTFSLDGEATTAMLGADYARDRWLVGLALMQTSGKGGYADTGSGPQGCPEGIDPEMAHLCNGAVQEGDGKVEASLTAAVPYGAWQASERLKLWGAAGYGTGEVTLKPEMGGSYKADIAWTMAALGARGDVIAPPAEGSGPALAVTSDALWARTSSDKTHDLAASESDVTRLRLGLEGSYRIALEEGGSVTPKLEVGARHDGGDAETGFGVELGGGLAWNDPALGLSLDLSGRTLIAHGNDDLKDRGYSASLAWDPDPATKRGPSFWLTQDWGGQAKGGLDALFQTAPLADRAGGGEPTARWQAEAAYGFPFFGDRFTGSPHVGLGLATGARDYSLGWRLKPAANTNAPDLSFGLKATRRESDGTVPEHTLGFEAIARW